jgi:dihydrofolate reductase
MGKLVDRVRDADGVMDDPGGGEDTVDRGVWAFRFDRGWDGDRCKFDELMAADVQLLGRRTYEGFARAWPSMDQDEFGQKMEAMEKVVYSSTIEDPSCNKPILNRCDRTRSRRQASAPRATSSCQIQPGPRRGGARRRAHLMVYPVVLGAGKRLFAESPELPFTLVESRPSSQVTLLTLRRA